MKKASSKIAVIGGGNIGVAIVRGLLRSGKIDPANIYLTKRNLNKAGELAGTGIHIGNDNLSVLKTAEIIVLAVLPSQLNSLLESLKKGINPRRHIIVSVVTAFSISEIKQRIGKEVTVIRAMPNIAASVGQSMSCISGADEDSEPMKKVIGLFDLIGCTLVISESLMGSATILGACGIAFFMRYLRAASQGGIQVGFHAADAQFIAAQTARGASMLLLESGNHPEREIDKVTTPMGCTIAGLNEMEHHGLSSALIKGIVTSYNEINKLK